MADLKNKKHIFFDLDDTLWDFEKNSGVILEALFAEFELASKLDTDYRNFSATYRKVNHELWTKYYRREIDKHYLRHQRFHEVFKMFGYHNFEENLLITEQYLERAPHGKELKEHCKDVLGYLNEKYTLHIITNGFKEIQHIKIDGCGLRDYFSHIIISEEYQLVKPDEQIFRLAEKMAGCSVNECVMIGDSYESDIVGALNAGWDAVHFAADGAIAGTGVVTIRSLSDLKTLL